MKCGRRETEADFLVVHGNGVPLLGKDTATKLGVLKIGVDVAIVSDADQRLRDQFPEVFKGVGKLNTHQVLLHICPDVNPVAEPMRRILFSLRDGEVTGAVSR